MRELFSEHPEKPHSSPEPARGLDRLQAIESLLLNQDRRMETLMNTITELSSRCLIPVPFHF